MEAPHNFDEEISAAAEACAPPQSWALKLAEIEQQAAKDRKFSLLLEEKTKHLDMNVLQLQDEVEQLTKKNESLKTTALEARLSQFEAEVKRLSWAELGGGPFRASLPMRRRSEPASPPSLQLLARYAKPPQPTSAVQPDDDDDDALGSCERTPLATQVNDKPERRPKQLLPQAEWLQRAEEEVHKVETLVAAADTPMVPTSESIGSKADEASNDAHCPGVVRLGQLKGGEEFDFLLVGAGHFNAGVTVGILQVMPQARVLIVDVNHDVGGSWLAANYFSHWIYPVPSRDLAYEYYLHNVTNLPLRRNHLLRRDDVLRELRGIYAWSNATLAFGHRYVGVRSADEDVHLLQSSWDSDPVQIRAVHVIHPQYRIMNSFNNMSTRRDQILRQDFSRVTRVRLLGNSLQAAEIINFMFCKHPEIPIEVVYRTPHLALFPNPLLMANWKSMMACWRSKTLEEKHKDSIRFVNRMMKAFDNHPGMVQYLEDYKASLQQDPEDFAGLKVMPLTNWPGLRAKISFKREAQTGASPRDALMTEERGVLVLDARNDQTPVPFSNRHAEAACPVMTSTTAADYPWSSLGVPPTPLLVFPWEPAGTAPSPVITGLAYAMILAHWDWREPSWSAETDARLRKSYLYYQALAASLPEGPARDVFAKLRYLPKNYSLCGRLNALVSVGLAAAQIFFGLDKSRS